MKSAEGYARFVWTSPELQDNSIRQFQWLTRQFRQAQLEAADEMRKLFTQWLFKLAQAHGEADRRVEGTALVMLANSDELHALKLPGDES